MSSCPLKIQRCGKNGREDAKPAAATTVGVPVMDRFIWKIGRTARHIRTFAAISLGERAGCTLPRFLGADRADGMSAGHPRPARSRSAWREKTILIDSLAIMLAIVVPTIIATLGFRLVVSSLQHAGDLPARLGVFRPHRTHRLGDSAPRDHAAGRRGLDRIP